MLSSMLSGDNTIPGEVIPTDIDNKLPEIFQLARDFGLDFPPTIIEFLDWDAMAEVCSYGGFPVRYPHWRWGMEWEQFRKGYMAGHHRVYEIVINTTPVILYCLNSNTYVDNVTVIIHALAHADFFKNNIFFKPTKQNALNQLANNSSRIKRYQARRGKDVVSKFIDRVLMLETLVDPGKIWTKRKAKEVVHTDVRDYKFPRKLKVENDYMEEWINTPEWMRQEEQRIKVDEIKKDLGLFDDPTKDILGFIKDNAPLKHWQQDILTMIYEEAQYFSPQRPTKIINEGWASYNDFNGMARLGLAGSEGIYEYAKHKAGVLGGKYSMNPYKLGFNLFMDIEDRWNKGRFGKEWDECDDMYIKDNWDKKLGLGHEKVFEVRKYYNDLLFINEFMTPEFIEKYEMFEWVLLPNGEYQIKSRDPVAIKKKLMRKFVNGGLPEIYLEEPNYKQKRYMLLKHKWDGRTLKPAWTKEVLASLYHLWQAPVILETKNKEENDMVFVCMSDDYQQVEYLSRSEAETLL